MKKILLLILLATFVSRVNAQSVVHVTPFTIPSTGTCTLTIACHNTFLFNHAVWYAVLSQPYNTEYNSIYSSSETVLHNDTLRAVFNIGSPRHGGFYAMSIYANNISINDLPDAVYMTGIDPMRINNVSPNFGVASTNLTTTISGAQMHFVTSTGFHQVGNVFLQSEIDNSIINNNTVTYLDSNNIDVNFTLPYNATNGNYTVGVHYNLGITLSRDRFFTVVGGVPKHIVSVTPPDALAGDSIDMIVTVAARNFYTNPCTFISLTTELTNYVIYIYNNDIQTLDSNHIRIKSRMPVNAVEGDYMMTLDGSPPLFKHYAFRIIPPNIVGYVYYDVDSNGVRNVGEPGLPGKKVMLLPDSILSITDVNGKYQYFADPGIYTVAYIADTICALSSTPATYNVTVIDTVYSGMNFGITCPVGEGHEFVVSNPTLRCSITGYSSWKITNLTYGTQQGRITFIHSNNLPVIYTSIIPDSTIGDTLIWHYTLAQHQQLICYLNFQDPPGGTPVWYICNDEVFNDLYTDTFFTVTTCSYDPNDKSVWPQEDAQQPSTLNSRELTYNINFQNTGTDTAFQVVIADTLNQFLDINTFQMVGSSHDVIANIDYPNRIVKFMHNPILLPDSNVDEPGSHGFVKFKIRAIQGLPDSVVVTNTGYIYFDFNPAVITNTVTSHLVYYKPPVANFTTASSSVCKLDCINFSNTSAYAHAWQWSFPGGIPSSSTDENPQGICYLDTGSYNVTLIAINGFTSDTIYIPNYLTVNVLPPPPVIYANDDTLFCIVDPLYTSYQWYDTTGIIPGATNSYYAPTFSGLFGLSVYNQQGCEAASTLPIFVGIEESSIAEISIFPNPADDRIVVMCNHPDKDDVIHIINLLGENLLTVIPSGQSDPDKIDLDVSNLSPGIYFVKFQNQERTIQERFVKN